LSADADAILDAAAKELEARYSEVEGELAAIEATKGPLKAEQTTIAEAINRLVGSCPAGYKGRAPARRTRSMMSDHEKTAAILTFVNGAGTEGTTNTDIGNAVGLSAATVGKLVNDMIAGAR